MLQTSPSETLLDLHTATLKSMLLRLPGGLPEVLPVDPVSLLIVHTLTIDKSGVIVINAVVQGILQRIVALLHT
jgi:hypothetical protein